MKSSNRKLQNKQNCKNNKWKIKLHKSHAQKKNVKWSYRYALCWFLNFVNDGKNKVGTFKIMRFIICYSNHANAYNQSAKQKKGVITYYKTYEIIIIKKHVNVNHEIVF